MLRTWLVFALLVAANIAQAQTTLSTGVPAPFSYPPQGSSNLFSGDQGFRVEVPATAAGLLVRAITLRAESTLSFHLRRDADVAIGPGEIVADLSIIESEDARIWTLEAQTLPPGTYFIAVSAGPYQQDLRGTIYAEVLAAPASPAAELDVPGASQIVLAGQPAGTTIGNIASAPENAPVLAPITFQPGRRIRFTANGTIDSARLGNDIPPEGRSRTDASGARFGLSALRGPQDALVGVFLGDVIDAENTPPQLQYEGGAPDAVTLEPLLQQTFYIGNGFTAKGNQREFVAPAGATRLFLGTKSVLPRNNTGAFHVWLTVELAQPRPVSQNPLVVPAIAHLALAGQPAGANLSFNTAPLNSPPQAQVVLRGGQRLQFTVRGKVLIRGRGLVPPSGEEVNNNSGRANGFSGLGAPRGSAIGVFTADEIDARAVPLRLNFDAELRAETELRPELQQMFYIGDGLTPNGERRTVVAPAGATRLYLAVHNRNNYADKEAFLVVVSVDDATVPSLPGNAVLNGASFVGGPVAPGLIVSIFGQNLAVAKVVNVTVPLPAALDGVQVFFDQYPAPLYFVSAGQINVQVPWELKSRFRALLTVVNNGVAGDPIEVDVEPFRPGIFDVQGLGPIVINNSTERLVSADEPAQSGDALIIFATGLGPVAPELISGAPAPLTFLTRGTFEVDAILIGGGQEVNVRPFFVGGAPGFVGVNQVNFIVSDEVPKGSATLRLQSPGFGATQDVAIFVD